MIREVKRCLGIVFILASILFLFTLAEVKFGETAYIPPFEEAEACTISRHCYSSYYCPAKTPMPYVWRMEAITGYENPADPWEWTLVKINIAGLEGTGPFILVFTIKSGNPYYWNHRILIRRVEAFNPKTVTYCTRPKRLTQTTGFPPTTPWMCRLKQGPWGGVVPGEYRVDVTTLVEEARNDPSFDGFLYFEMEYRFDWLGSSGHSGMLTLEAPPHIESPPPE